MKNRFEFPYVNSLYVLVGLNLLLFVIPLLFSYLLSTNADRAYGTWLYLLGGLRADLVLRDGEWWRMLTSTFLHADILHLFSNMFALFQIGYIVQNYYGRRWLWSFYVIGGLSGSLLSLIFLGALPTVGASGAVFGLMGVLVGGAMRKSRFGASLPFRPMDILPLTLYAFAIGLVPNSPVNNWAHLGGFVAGVICGQLFSHQLGVSHRDNVKRDMVFWLCAGFVAVCYILLAISLYSKLFA